MALRRKIERDVKPERVVKLECSNSKVLVKESTHKNLTELRGAFFKCYSDIGRSRDEEGGTATFAFELYNLLDESVMTHADFFEWHHNTDILEMKATLSAVQWFKKHYFKDMELDKGQHLLCITDCINAFERFSSLKAWPLDYSRWFDDYLNLSKEFADLENSTPTLVFGWVPRDDPRLNRVDVACYELRTKDKDDDIDPEVFYDERVAFLVALKAKGESPYRYKFSVTMTVPKYKETYGSLGKGVSRDDVSESIAGKIMARRSPSSKFFVYKLHWSGVTINVTAGAGNFDMTEAEFTEFHTGVKRGDIVGLTGFPAKNNKGELSFMAKSFTVLSHCLHKMPKQQKAGSAAKAEAWTPGKPRNPEMYVLKDQETRCRQPYLDLLLNAEVREIFKTRSMVFSYIRRFLDKLGFLEVPMPAMNMIAGGGAARPFSEHYLKELVVGVLNSVYEFGNQFRNEGIDLTHNPELTTCKLCMAFADCNELMKLTEEMLSEMVKELTGDYVVQYHANGLDKDPIKINFARPFRQIDVIEELEKMSKLNIPKDLASEETNAYLIAACEKFEVTCPPPQTTPLLLDKLVGHFLKETCVDPCFIINHPEIMKLLANGRAESFELFVNKHEVCNGFTELNDPVVQKEFAELKVRQSGNDEAKALHETFCKALEYGLPPTAGWELGIDRMTMLLTDSQNIKEVLFPAMKPQDESLTKAASEEH